MESNVWRIPAIRFDGKRKCKGYLSLCEKQFVFFHDMSCDVYPFDLQTVTITESKAKLLGMFQNKGEQIIHISIDQKNSDIRFCVANGTASILNQALNQLWSYRVKADKLLRKDMIAEQNKLCKFRSGAKEKRQANWTKLQQAKVYSNAESHTTNIEPEDKLSSNAYRFNRSQSDGRKNKPQSANVFLGTQVVRRKKTDHMQLVKTELDEDHEKKEQIRLLVACLEAIINKYDYRPQVTYHAAKEHNSTGLLYQNEPQRRAVLQQLILLLSQRAKKLEDIENKLAMRTMIDTDDIHRVASIYLNIKNRHQGKMALYNELRKQYGNDVGISYYHQIVD